MFKVKSNNYLKKLFHLSWILNIKTSAHHRICYLSMEKHSNHYITTLMFVNLLRNTKSSVSSSLSFLNWQWNSQHNSRASQHLPVPCSWDWSETDVHFLPQIVLSAWQCSCMYQNKSRKRVTFINKSNTNHSWVFQHLSKFFWTSFEVFLFKNYDF